MLAALWHSCPHPYARLNEPASGARSVSPAGLMARATFLMHVGYSLAGFACAEVVKPCQRALACSDGARLDAIGG